MTNEFRARLKRREKLLGTMVTLASAASAEVLASLGFDWLFIDGEHGPLETRELASILQAVGDKTACIVRVPEVAEVPIKKALDKYDVHLPVNELSLDEERRTRFHVVLHERAYGKPCTTARSRNSAPIDSRAPLSDHDSVTRCARIARYFTRTPCLITTSTRCSSEM